MNFAGSMEAKEFLVSRIVEEARGRHVKLSDLERKMLYFSETYPTLPDMMEVAQEFESKYDDEKYEEKIKRLSRRAFDHDRRESPDNVRLWREAITLLKKEDHYILVMLDVPRSVTDLLKAVFVGLVVTGALVGAYAAVRWAAQHIHVRIPTYLNFLALIFVFALAYYLSYSDKGKKLGDGFAKLTERVARWF